MNELLAALLELNAAAAAAILILVLVRRPAHHVFGPHAVYLLWMLVPVACFATLIPSRAVETLSVGLSLDEIVALAATPTTIAGWEVVIAPGLITLWIAGIIITSLALARRQAAFLREAELGLAGPAIVGFSHPRIVTPDDFSRRFTDAERKLILTHEQVHLERNDTRINAFVALIRCVFWFNPMVHIGAAAMRADQELSCDAEVIDRRPRVRRAYAETLLKTQLVSHPLPVGCYWPTEKHHPLTDRIDMLARKPVSGPRRIAATGIVLALSAGAGFAAWAAQPERTIVREAPDMLVPFQPIPRDQQFNAMVTTKPHPAADFAQPDYPFDAISAKIEGDVGVELCVAASGAVTDVKITHSSGHQSLDSATLAGLHMSHFQPATREGRPVSLCGYAMTMGWRLSEAPTPTGPPAPATR
jgi:TonB family protein